MSGSQIGWNEELPDEITTLITAGLNIRSASRLSRTATHFCNFFRKPDFWMAKIAAEFNITPQMFIKLSKIIDANEYMGIYQRLRKLKMSLAHLPKSVRYTYLDEENKFFLLACCTDRPDYFLEIMNPEEFMLWLELSLYAGCVRVPILFYTKTLDAYFPMQPIGGIPEGAKTRLDRTTVRMTIQANRLDMIKYLFDPYNDFDITRDTEFLALAATQRSNEIYNFFIQKEFGLGTLAERYPYTNPENPPLLWEDDPSWWDTATDRTRPKTMNLGYLNSGIAASGDLAELRSILEDPNSDTRLIPNGSTLYHAADSGNLEMVKYLIHKFNLAPDHSTLAIAVYRRSLSLVRFLLSPDNHFHIMVNEAAMGQNEGIEITRLINSHDAFTTALCLLNENDRKTQRLLQELLNRTPSLDRKSLIVTHLTRSFISAPRYHLNRLLDTLANSTSYNLTSSAINSLSDYAQSLTTQRDVLNSSKNNKKFMNSVLDEFAAKLVLKNTKIIERMTHV